MVDDVQLLRDYAERRSEAAFATLVERHLGLVYRAALRELGGDARRAEEVAQNVFVLLATKARALLGHGSLVAWLHTTTHFKVSELLRAERRRQARETAAHLMHELTHDDAGARDWEQLRPVIDDVLRELRDTDREAVLLRYFEARPFAEIAARLGLNESAAHKRVERALESLRERLERRGVKSTSAALASVIGTHAALAAPPAGLAGAVASGAMSAGLPAVTAWHAGLLMSTKTAALTAAAVVAVAGGWATRQVSAEHVAVAQLASAEAENAALVARLREAEQRRQPRTLAAAVTPKNAPVSPSATASLARMLGSGGLASPEESRLFLEANPDVREALVAYYRATLGSEYAELFTRLGLGEPERERFISIMAAGIRRILGEHQFTLGAEMLSGAEITRQLRELLGEEGYQAYREFRAGGLQRSFASEMARALYFTSTPFSPGQAEQLKQLVTRVTEDPALGPAYSSGVWPYYPEARWNQLVAEAERIFPAEQVEALRDLQRQSRFFHAQTAALKAWHAAKAPAKEATK